MNNTAFTLLEMMMAVSFSVLLMAGVYGFYNTSSQIYSTGISGQNLQDGANIVLSKIMAGGSESSVPYRLSTSTSFAVACTSNCAPSPAVLYTCGGTPQSIPCNANNPFSELYFCQDSPCSPGDATARWYYLDSTGRSVFYHSPSIAQDVNIYTAPQGAAVNLRFSPAQSNGQSLPNVVEIDVDLTTIPQGNSTDLPAATCSGASANRLATCGDASTFVLLRNHL